jgi:hypothetical protein
VLGSLNGKPTEVDMKFTREHGVVRSRIDCAESNATPRRLDHYYDGEGLATYIDIEAPDGSVVPAGILDSLDDGVAGNGSEEKGGEKKIIGGSFPTSFGWEHHIGFEGCGDGTRFQ